MRTSPVASEQVVGSCGAEEEQGGFRSCRFSASSASDVAATRVLVQFVGAESSPDTN
jgi:hypothetical protein